MPLPRILRGFRRVALLCVLTASLAEAQSQQSYVTLTPAFVVAGSPELIRVIAPNVDKVEGDWLGRKLQFFSSRDGRSWLALAGVDVEGPVGSSTLRITERLATST